MNFKNYTILAKTECGKQNANNNSDKLCSFILCIHFQNYS